MLRVDPRQRPRLAEIIKNLKDRIDEARLNGWLGKVEGLHVSLDAAQTKLAALDRSMRRRNGVMDLSIPAVPATPRPTTS